ncbi:pimeloyl-ACP methyl ester carboxylesterase [Aliiruegeria haliotis]|uniref:Pimeloyl-ACP methyl ester carboxylesterase n=1 Tax=Aliiruegeria haliotis TaxID=1280846 RepID=A0A2T0S0J3_9RHOB|nr:alpha/beta hydrolase [Aliiruegeria haliotis]PRY26948.1 pimeloyl-ACP methyl ester carboxylesterase [Aliiruegeria haliotis]
MSDLHIDSSNSIFFLHTLPTREGAPTFVFVNALTGSTDHWEAAVAPSLRKRGFGTLSYNYRGQDKSPFAQGTELTNSLIVDDLVRLLREISPRTPILTGLSIGGLYASQAYAKGAAASGIVLLNTLREINPRIAWINDALPHYVATGGAGLFMGLMMPLLTNPDFASGIRQNYLSGPYTPLDRDHGHANLMRNSVDTRWDFDWSSLNLPVLSITGLHDRVFRDPEVIDRLFSLLPDARREDWDNAGHLLPLERPEQLAESLAKFAAEIEQP